MNISVRSSLFYLYYYKAYTNLLQNVKIYQNLFKTLVPLSVKRNKNKHKDTVLNHNCTKLQYTLH